MHLTELQPGMPISLEINMNDSSYALPSSVISVKSNYILISPLSYNNKAIDLGGRKGLTYNLYAIDPDSENRIVWRGVTLETVSYKNSDIESTYYKVTINAFASLGALSDRRKNKRIVLDIPGWILFDVDDIQHQVTVHDISDHGVSFVTLENLDFPTNTFYMAFSDSANGKDFHLRFKCVIVRQLSQGLQTFYGCDIPTPTRDFLTYVFLKALESKMEHLKAKQEQEALKEAEAAARAQADAMVASMPAANTPAASATGTGKGYHFNVSGKR